MRLRLVRDYLVYLVLRSIVCVIQALPIEVCESLAKALAVLACDVVRIRRGVVDENLQHGFPDWTPAQRLATARGMWAHLFLLACELTHVPRKIHETNWHRHVQLTNIEPMVATLLEPRPKVVLTGHFGNFEVGGYMCALLGFPTHTIVRPLDNPYVDRFLSQFRLSTGQRVLPKQGSAWQVQDVLDENGSLGLLGDQAAGIKGCKVNFFNRPTYCHKAIAVFALANKAPLMVTSTTRLDRPMQFNITLLGQYDAAAPNQEACTVADVTQWYCRLLEESIRRKPHQYWWVHRLWKDVQPRRKKRRPAAGANPVAPEQKTDSSQPPAVVPLPESRPADGQRKTA